MPKAGIVRPDDDFLIILYDGEIAPTSPVKTYFPVIEQTVQSIVKDYILRNATLQSFSGREQPQPVGLDQCLVDIVGRQQNGLMLFFPGCGKPYRDHDFIAYHCPRTT